jgi:hypothetical protein
MEALLPIPISDYVLITSGVGAGSNVPNKNLGGLIVSPNALIPTGAVVSFNSAAAVGTYFGTTSEEYYRAVFYFGWISKNIQQPNQLSFWNWNGNANTPSLIYGAQAAYALVSFTPITTGDFTLTMAGATAHVTGINFSSAGNLAAVASTLQTAIRAANAAWTSAVVSYVAAPTQGGSPQFTLSSGVYGTDTISVSAGTTTDVVAPLGWGTGSILSNGTNAQTVTANLTSLINLTNNFGSFCFETQPYQRALITAQIATTGVMSVSAVAAGTLAVGQIITGTSVPSNTTITALVTGTGTTGTYSVSQIPASLITSEAMVASASPSLTEITAAATWNNGLTPNNQFLFSIAVTATNASAWSAALLATGGCALTLVSPQAQTYSEMEPMMILGATNYQARNSVQNYMFQQFNDTASVTNATNQALYDGLDINYYGNTQTAGQILSFYQRGVMMGSSVATNPTDMGVYANEIWLKDAIGAALMSLLLSLAEVPANLTGQAQITASVQSIINQALFNGTISVGKALTTTQQLYITQQTGSPTAWQQVQNQGYWFNVVIQQFVIDSIPQYKAVYTLIYSKNDTIRFIAGSDVLI